MSMREYVFEALSPQTQPQPACQPYFQGMGILSKFFGGSSSSTSRKQPSATVEDLCHRFSFKQLRKSTDGFDESRLIATGASSNAYRASISVNGELKHVTVKRIRQRKAINPERRILYKKNIIFRCQLHHPNLVSLVGFCDDHDEIIVVYDYPPKGSLRDQLYRTEGNSPTLSWKRRLEISIGVARGLHHLHSGTKRTIIHRDIKPASILLDENWVPKLKFSGLSLKGPKFSEKEPRPIELGSNPMIGSVGYIAPELLRNTAVTHKCDVYSFGALLLELICGNHPPHIFWLHQDLLAD
ncbi:hypothetical protein K1719_004544 [Acacia pycnantha]|nr:hypothetical protein K1719_004544 [Acacia pycnantha]